MNETLGEKRVRVNFNTSGNSKVDQVKKETAKLIDILEEAKLEAFTSEEVRLFSLAQTSFEEGGMWAVKALTSNL